ncbi:MAG: hypothetical protein IBX55_01020 [Methyloprofundus sp.]|nr:hypothetical protein [Methyloprofundus sp.]
MDMVRLNQTHELRHPFIFNPNHIKGLKIKDASPKKVIQNHPELEPIINHLFSLIPNQKHLLVDINHTDFSKENLTCRNSDWHLDGRMIEDFPEHYAIWSAGEFRTKFMDQVIQASSEMLELTNPLSRFKIFHDLLGEDLKNDEMGFEVPEMTPITYTTFDFHKGRKVKTRTGDRFFIRVMSSNYIRPRPLRRLAQH